MTTSLDEAFYTNTQNMIQAAMAVDFTDLPTYAAWLAQTYFYASHSHRLLCYFSDKSVNPAVKARWSAHSSEEHGHHRIALRDLTNLGFDILDYEPLDATKELYSTQYAIADQTHGIDNFGWAIALEGLAAGIPSDFIDVIVQHYPSNCTNFLRLHVEEDVEHIREALAAVEHVGETSGIIDNMSKTADRYIRLLHGIA